MHFPNHQFCLVSILNLGGDLFGLPHFKRPKIFAEKTRPRPRWRMKHQRSLGRVFTSRVPTDLGVPILVASFGVSGNPIIATSHGSLTPNGGDCKGNLLFQGNRSVGEIL